MTGIDLTPSELVALREFGGLPETASVEAVKRRFADNWWYNHAHTMCDGDPIDALPGVRTEILHRLIAVYESDYRGQTDWRD